MELTFDCRGGDAIRVVAGLPLCARHARVAARVGARRVILVADDEAAVHDALRRRPAPIEVTVDRSAGASAGEAALPGLAVYVPGEAGPELLAPVRTDEEARAAERLLVQRLRKSVALDGAIAYHTMRPLSRALARLVVGTRVTPNQVTLAAMALGLAAAVAATRPGWGAGFVAGLLFWLGGVIDCVDGELARLRLEGSRLGEWLDIVADHVATLGILFGLGLGIGGRPWSDLGTLGLVVGLASGAIIHLDLHRLGLRIDSAYYPWAFLGPPAKEPASGGLAAIAHLFRRDAQVTFVAILCALGLRREAFVYLLATVLVTGGMLLLHYAFKLFRGSAGRSP